MLPGRPFPQRTTRLSQPHGDPHETLSPVPDTLAHAGRALTDAITQDTQMSAPPSHTLPRPLCRRFRVTYTLKHTGTDIQACTHP